MGNDLGVFLWGAKGAGKTSLIYSFAYYIEQNYKRWNGLQFILRNINGDAINVPPPGQIADIRMGTRELHLYNWVFGRSFSEEGDNAEDAYSKRISSQEHNLLIYDAPGGYLDQLVDPNITDAYEVNALRDEIIESPNIFVLLDQTMLVQEPALMPSNERVRITQSEYTMKVRNLFELLSRNIRLRRHIAICVTKADYLDAGLVDHAQKNDENAWHLIRMKFGHNMLSVINAFKSYHEIKPFVLSTKREGMDEWQPDGIEWPLFWLFERMEIKHISEGAFIPKKDIFTHIFASERMKYYIHYPKPAYAYVNGLENANREVPREKLNSTEDIIKSDHGEVEKNRKLEVIREKISDFEQLYSQGNFAESLLMGLEIMQMEGLSPEDKGRVEKVINEIDKLRLQNEKLKSKQQKEQFRVSVVHPKLLSKRFESIFLFQVYLPEKRDQVLSNLGAEFKSEGTNEYIYQSSIWFNQKIRVKFFSPEFRFSDAVVKIINEPVNKIVFLGMPLDNCEPGLHKILVSITDVETEQEFESLTLTVRVVDFAFDHVSRPLLSRTFAVVLGIGSFAMFILTFLEQIDKTVGLTSGTAAGILGLAIYANFYNLYQRVRPNTP